jgi:hypothetical protein
VRRHGALKGECRAELRQHRLDARGSARPHALPAGQLLVCQRRHVSSPMLDRSCANRAAGLADRPEMPADGLKYASFLCIARGVGMHSAAAPRRCLRSPRRRRRGCAYSCSLCRWSLLSSRARGRAVVRAATSTTVAAEMAAEMAVVAASRRRSGRRSALSVIWRCGRASRLPLAQGGGSDPRTPVTTAVHTDTLAHRHPCTQTPLHTASNALAAASYACTWHMAHGTWHMAHGTGHMPHGTWHMAHGTWHMVRADGCLDEQPYAFSRRRRRHPRAVGRKRGAAAPRRAHPAALQTLLDPLGRPLTVSGGDGGWQTPSSPRTPEACAEEASHKWILDSAEAWILSAAARRAGLLAVKNPPGCTAPR